jgi:secreted trypsin-like serine protease
MRRLICTAAAAAAVLVPAAPAAAITNGAPDGSGHPNVGGLVAATPYSDGTSIYCSGTLIAPSVFVTAAHCAEGDRVRVTFDPAYEIGDPVYAGTFHSDPAYNGAQSDPHDIAVVVLDKAPKITPARLPTADSLSGLSGDQKFTSVGYGAYAVTSGPHEFLYDDVRGVAVGTLNSINTSWLRISMNASHGDGGTCYGDSGGPNFLGASNTLAATTITGDAVCKSTNVTYRLDTASARGFLDDYVTLP